MKRITSILVCLAFIGLSAFAQDIQITGKVTSMDDGSLLPGVSVVVRGTTTGVATDIDGNYSIKAPADAVLVFTSVGMVTQEVAVDGRSVIDVEMESSTTALDEVVVTALAINRSQKALGYSTQQVTGDDISEAPEQNLINSLNGRVSGVHITNSSGAVGSSSRIVLRGASSLFGNNQPLFVVDGVPVSNGNVSTTTGYGGFDTPNAIADINPNDIESITVLKGPSAGVLYGVSAANGVIIITTKKGKKGKGIGIEFNQSVTFESPLVIPDYQNSYGQGPNKDFFEYVNGTSADGGVDESWGPPLDVGLNFMQFTSFINNPENPQPEPWVSHPDNIKNFYETGITSKSDLAVSGGNDNATYRLGVSYSDQKGIIPFTDFKKMSANASSTVKLSKRINSSFSMKYIKSSSDNLPNSGYDGSNVIQQTIWAGRNVDFEALKDWRNIPTALPGSTYGAGELPINWNTQFQNNPYWQLETNKSAFDRNRFIGNFGINVDFTDWLTLSTTAGIDYYLTKTSVSWAKGSAGDAPTYWRYLGNRDASEGFYDEDHRNFKQTYANASLALNKEIGPDFKVNVIVGTKTLSNHYTFDYRAVQLELPGLYNLGNIKSGTSLFNRNTHSQYTINSIYALGELSFREFAYASFAATNDWASVLPMDNNSYFYPSVNLSLLLSEVIDLSAARIDYLKLRGSWAQVGGFGPLGPGDILPVYELSSLPWAGNTFGNYPSTLNNTQIKPQTNIGSEVGLELRMFQSRLRLDATYYDQTSRDLILPVQVTASSGVSFVWDNVGEIRNRGIELQLGATLIQAGDFSLDLTFNWSKNNNEVLKAGKDEENDEETLVLGNLWNMNLEAREGYPFGVIVGSSLERNEDGEVIFQNGLPMVGDDKVLGDIQPDWTGGVNLEIAYKGLSLNTLVDAKIGGEVYSMTTAWGRYAGILEESLIGRETGIVGDGVIMLADSSYIPNNVVVSAETFNHNAYSNDIVESAVFDASYVKLRQVALSYSLPQSLVNKIGFEGIAVSAIGRNLAILYKKVPHIDPETGFDNSDAQQGMEFGQLPSTRSYGFSLNVKF